MKICGITTIDDGMAAAEAGADLLGFVFYPPSPRYVSPERAERIIREIRAAYPTRPRSDQREHGEGSKGDLAPIPAFVGVFVDEAPERLRGIMEQCELDLVQFHGAETPELLRRFAPRCYKAIRPLDQSGAARLLDTFRGVVNGNLPSFIVDTFKPNLYGGTGERGDWSIARTIAREFPILLAGGLTPENVGQAISAVQPWGVDVSSGVESKPGLKDHAKVRRLVEVAKNKTGVPI